MDCLTEQQPPDAVQRSARWLRASGERAWRGGRVCPLLFRTVWIVKARMSLGNSKRLGLSDGIRALCATFGGPGLWGSRATPPRGSGRRALALCCLWSPQCRAQTLQSVSSDQGLALIARATMCSGTGLPSPTCIVIQESRPLAMLALCMFHPRVAGSARQVQVAHEDDCTVKRFFM